VPRGDFVPDLVAVRKVDVGDVVHLVGRTEQRSQAHHRLFLRDHDRGHAAQVAGQGHVHEVDQQVAAQILVRVARAAAVLRARKALLGRVGAGVGQLAAVGGARRGRQLGQSLLEVANLIEVLLHPLLVVAAELRDELVGALLDQVEHAELARDQLLVRLEVVGTRVGRHETTEQRRVGLLRAGLRGQGLAAVVGQRAFDPAGAAAIADRLHAVLQRAKVGVGAPQISDPLVGRGMGDHPVVVVGGLVARQQRLHDVAVVRVAAAPRGRDSRRTRALELAARDDRKVLSQVLEGRHRAGRARRRRPTRRQRVARARSRGHAVALLDPGEHRHEATRGAVGGPGVAGKHGLEEGQRHRDAAEAGEKGTTTDAFGGHGYLASSVTR